MYLKAHSPITTAITIAMTRPPPIDSNVTMEPRWTIATSVALTGSLVLTLTTSGGGIVVPLGGLGTRGVEVLYLEPILRGFGIRGIVLFSGLGGRTGREELNRGPLIGSDTLFLCLCLVLLVE